MVVRVLVFLVLAGCGSSGFELRDVACPVDVTAYTRDLTHHLVRGDGTGAFDYETGLPVIAGVSGSYDLLTGDFSWSEAGAEGSTLKSAEVEGYGWAQESGDLDVIGTRVAIDVLDQEVETQFRVVRTGCDSEIRTRQFTNGVAQETVETGTFGEDGYAYVQERDVDGSVYRTEGVRDENGVFTEEISFESSTYTLDATRTGEAWGGTSERSFSEIYQTQNGTAERVGTEDRLRDGTRRLDYVQSSRQGDTRWVYEVDYAGDGSGTVSGNGFECTLSFEDGRCTYDCGRGQRGSC